jgi:hypothetical protein
MERRGLNIFLLILKILVPVALIAFLVWAIVDLIGMHIEDMKHVGESGYFSGYGLTFLAFVILGLMYNGIALVVSLVGLIISVCYKGTFRHKKNVITFVILMIAPVVAELLIFLMGNLIPRIVG